MALKRESTDSHRFQGVKKNEPHRDRICKESLDIMYFLKFFTVKELNTERYFIVWAAKLNQQIYFKGILNSKYGSKDMLLWKRGSSFLSTEDENLWIASRPTWFDGPRSFKVSGLDSIFFFNFCKT